MPMTPMRLDMPVAQRYADMGLIERDLQHVIKCCDELLKRNHPPSSVHDLCGLALLDSALIRYRRCFKGGVRTHIAYLTNSLSPQDSAMHEFMIELCSKHIAHSVNNFETAYGVVWVDLETGERSSVGALGRGTLQVNLQTITEFKQLSQHFVDEVRREQTQLGMKFQSETDVMSDDQIRHLEICKIYSPPNVSGGR